MKKSINANILFLVCAVLITVFIIACSENTTTNTQNPGTPEAGTMSGTITFYDTNRVYSSNGYYDLSAYSSWPPTGAPNGSDTIKLTKNGNQYIGTFKVKGLTGGGSYVLVAAWIKTPYGPGSVYVQGVRGCDTNRTCYFVNPKRDTLPTNQGLENLNFNAALDTTSKVRF